MNQIESGIQYVGLPGVTQECLDGVMRLIQYGDRIQRARILSAANMHGLLLTVVPGDLFAIKCGFSSGYGGEGPRKFSFVLQLLQAHHVEIDEFEVGEDFLARVDGGTLTERDISTLETMRPIRPKRYHEFIEEKHFDMSGNGTLWREFAPVIPLGIIDARIVDLAIHFWEDADGKLMTTYRRLEDNVRARIGS